jgi:hypothetical protein
VQQHGDIADILEIVLGHLVRYDMVEASIFDLLECEVNQIVDYFTDAVLEDSISEREEAFHIIMGN